MIDSVFLLSLVGYNNYMTGLYFEIFIQGFLLPVFLLSSVSLLSGHMLCAHHSGKYVAKQKTEENF